MSLKIATPITLPCGVTLPNRLFKSAMTEGLADERDCATDAHATLYRRWSEGGTGTLVTGNVMIDNRFLERPGNVVIDPSKEHLDQSVALKAWSDAGTTAGNQLWMQINHPGRQCQKLVAARPLSPSEVPLNILGLFGRPKAMTEADIEQVIAGFAHVATVAKGTGFTGVQVHSAHGYLLSQFLSPRTNLRSDHWGGSLDNRARLLLEVIKAARAAVGPHFPISVKLNSSDFSKGGFTHEESLKVARWLSEIGIDLLEISGGTYEKIALAGDGIEEEESTTTKSTPTTTKAREAYFMEYAAGIREVINIPLAVTGGFRSVDAMENALASGALDIIGVARPLCTEPDAQALLDGRAKGFTPYEKQLSLGPGLFGPTSRNATLRTLNFSAATNWYYRQILKLANNEQPDVHLGTWRALVTHMFGERQVAAARVAPST